MSYNLVEESWIPVLWNNGKVDRVGIRVALTQAERIRQIATSNPMDRVAILRFLLALLYWSKGNPPDKIPDGSFPPDYFEKLHDNKDCFNLLGDGKPFYQDSNAKRDQAVTQLIQEIPAGNNFWHFRHSTDWSDGLCRACCAIGLLRLPLFSVSGLSGPGEPNLMAGINGVPPIYVVPLGKSLKETLLANWTSRSNLGEPSWDNPNSPPNPDEIPLLTGLTLLSRRVLLHEPDGKEGICIGCGLHETALIKTIEYQTAGKQENGKWNDPHVIYIAGAVDGEGLADETKSTEDSTKTDESAGVLGKNEKQRKSLRAEDLTKAGKFKMDRPWPNLLARILEKGISRSLLVVGFATNKAKNIDVWERNIEMSYTIEEKTANIFKKWQKDKLEERLREIMRGTRKLRKEDTRDVTSAVASIRPHVEGKVSARIGELVAGGDDAWEKAASEYSPMMATIAKSLSPGFTTAAVQRRSQIARVKPDMRQKTDAVKKSRRRKGRDQ